jgi:hypothetical protein
LYKKVIVLVSCDFKGDVMKSYCPGFLQKGARSDVQFKGVTGLIVSFVIFEALIKNPSTLKSP